MLPMTYWKHALPSGMFSSPTVYFLVQFTIGALGMLSFNHLSHLGRVGENAKSETWHLPFDSLYGDFPTCMETPGLKNEQGEVLSAACWSSIL